jgi:hypothetical protein
MPADYFIVGSLPLLAQLVRHCEAAEVLAKALRTVDGEANLALWGKLTRMACRESAAISMLSVKLRLAPSARFDSKKRIPAGRAGVKPWNRHVP